jgi:hypothetical protein
MLILATKNSIAHCVDTTRIVSGLVFTPRCTSDAGVVKYMLVNRASDRLTLIVAASSKKISR